MNLEDTCVQTITVIDNEPPTLENVPDATTINCTDELPSWTVTACDNCDDDVPVNDPVIDYRVGTTLSGLVIYSFIATDDCDNTDTAVVTASTALSVNGKLAT